MGKKGFEAVLLKWGITKESLVDSKGFEISNAIVLKANTFLANDCLKFSHSEPINLTKKEYWICFPLETYNKTAYTMYFTQYTDFINVGCNCQWGSYNRVCSHVLALLIKKLGKQYPAYRINVYGGVRQKRYRIDA